jgi:hypothetical protein
MIKKGFFVLCVLFLMSCKKQEVNDTFPNAHQLILFQVEYINYAWGFSHSGFLIDSSGIVTTFKYPKNWHHADSTGYISVSDMENNIRQLDTITFTISKNELLKNFSMLEKISKGKLIKPPYRAFDAGTTDFSGFLFDSNKQQYKHILIKRVGDCPIENNSPEAEEVFQWLLKVCIKKPLT